MANIRALAQQHIGRLVIVHSNYGVHRGILHHIDDNGMYLQLHHGNHLAAASEQASIRPLSEVGSAEINAQEVFWPFFFIPWAAAWALGPWGWYW